MMIDNNKNEAQRWLEQAKHDLNAARDSIKSGHLEWTCFQSQQAAEKALKAFLFLKRQNHIIVHSINGLLRLCEQVGLDTTQIQNAQILDTYYIPARYPNGVPYGAIPHTVFSEIQAKQAIELAGSVIDAVSNYI